MALRLRCSPWLAAGVLLGLLAPASLHAQAAEVEAKVEVQQAHATLGAAQEPAEYAHVVDAALAAHREGRFEDARALLERAHELFPNARTLRGLGKVEFELGNYERAVVHLGAALASETRPLDERLRLEVSDLLARARSAMEEEAPDEAAPAEGQTSLAVQAEEAPSITPAQPSALDKPKSARKRWVALAISAASTVGAAIAVGFWLRPSAAERSEPDGGSTGVVLRNL